MHAPDCSEIDSAARSVRASSVRPSARELCVLVRDHASGRASKRASVCARSRARAPVRPRARACVRSVYARSGPVLPLLGVSRQISTRPSRFFSANRLSILVTFETHGTGYQPPPNRFRASRLSNRGRPVQRSPAYRGTIPMPMYKFCPLSTVRISRTPVWSGERGCETTSSRENGAKMLLQVFFYNRLGGPALTGWIMLLGMVWCPQHGGVPPAVCALRLSRHFSSEAFWWNKWLAAEV